MPTPPKPEAIVSCACGSVALKALAAPMQDTDGGTAYVVYRKDRVMPVRGASLLKNYKLDAASATNRVVEAGCGQAGDDFP